MDIDGCPSRYHAGRQSQLQESMRQTDPYPQPMVGRVSAARHEWKLHHRTITQIELLRKLTHRRQKCVHVEHSSIRVQPHLTVPRPIAPGSDVPAAGAPEVCA